MGGTATTVPFPQIEHRGYRDYWTLMILLAWNITTSVILNSWKSWDKSSDISIWDYLEEGREPDWYSEVF